MRPAAHRASGAPIPTGRDMTLIPATDRNIRRAAQALREGELVAFPTETVYGLGTDATNGEAVAAIFEAKGRPHFNPLIVHVANLEEARKYAVFSNAAEQLAQAFWPGALTLVLPKLADSPIADLTTAGLDTIALRAPAHPVAQALLEAAGVPIAAPSANRSGHVSPTLAAHVEADLGKHAAFILDDGPAQLGLESTVIDASSGNPVLLRPGAIPRAEIEAQFGMTLGEAGATERPTSPGQLASHYAPRASLRLDATETRDGEALLAFGAEVPVHKGPCINLSSKGDLREAAAKLFAALRELDASGARNIAVMPIPTQGLGEAINDRLKRAAAPRES